MEAHMIQIQKKYVIQGCKARFSQNKIIPTVSTVINTTEVLDTAVMQERDAIQVGNRNQNVSNLYRKPERLSKAS